MSLETLRAGIPDWAKDTRLNLGSIVGTPATLSEQQHWGAVLASAAAVRSPRVLVELLEEARGHLSEAAVTAALSAASIMAMNNVYYRSRHLLDGRYDDLPARLRMQIIGSPGVPKVDFELWAISVSAINGCGSCLESHEHVVREGGLSREQVHDALRIAAVVSAAAQAVDTAAVLQAV
ncbi:MAG: alkyl hydroperoxide reductase [Actinomycetota bacterium]|nr:MAG: alkyl hydroperoxide reductase [Actinomycetota bacterium]